MQSSELGGGSLGANYIIVCLITLTLDITHCRMIGCLTLSRKLRTMEGKEIISSIGINDERAKISNCNPPNATQNFYSTDGKFRSISS
jgi:hypothetical protein